jgi:hypothetical protein
MGIRRFVFYRDFHNPSFTDKRGKIRNLCKCGLYSKKIVSSSITVERSYGRCRTLWLGTEGKACSSMVQFSFHFLLELKDLTKP